MVEMRKLMENIQVQEAANQLYRQQKQMADAILTETTGVLKNLTQKIAVIEADSIKRIQDIGRTVEAQITRKILDKAATAAAERQAILDEIRTARAEIEAGLDQKLRQSLAHIDAGLRKIDTLVAKISDHELRLQEEWAARRKEMTDRLLGELDALRAGPAPTAEISRPLPTAAKSAPVMPSASPAKDMSETKLNVLLDEIGPIPDAPDAMDALTREMESSGLMPSAAAPVAASPELASLMDDIRAGEPDSAEIAPDQALAELVKMMPKDDKPEKDETQVFNEVDALLSGAAKQAEADVAEARRARTAKLPATSIPPAPASDPADAPAPPAADPKLRNALDDIDSLLAEVENEDKDTK